jgi:hypothetical protein
MTAAAMLMSVNDWSLIVFMALFTASVKVFEKKLSI